GHCSSFGAGPAARSAAGPGDSLLGQVAGAARTRLLVGAGRVVPGGGERLAGLGDGRLGRDAELLVETLVVGGGAVVLEAHAPAGVADDLVPALGDRRLDRDTGLDRRRQDGLLVGVVLEGEPLARGHGDHAGGDAVGLEGLP